MTADRKRIGCEHERTEIEVLSNRDGYPDFELEGECKICGAMLYMAVDAAEMEAEAVEIIGRHTATDTCPECAGAVTGALPAVDEID